MIPRFGDSKRTDQHYRRRPGVYAILARGDRLLLTQQSAPVPEFQLPGGGIDRGEQPIPALHREVAEETGWRIEIDRLMGVFRRFTYMPEYGFWAEKVCSVYLARPVRRLGPPTEAGHLAIWLPVEDAVVRLANPGDRAMVARVFGKRGTRRA